MRTSVRRTSASSQTTTGTARTVHLKDGRKSFVVKVFGFKGYPRCGHSVLFVPKLGYVDVRCCARSWTCCTQEGNSFPFFFGVRAILDHSGNRDDVAPLLPAQSGAFRWRGHADPRGQFLRRRALHLPKRFLMNTIQWSNTRRLHLLHQHEWSSTWHQHLPLLTQPSQVIECMTPCTCDFSAAPARVIESVAPALHLWSRWILFLSLNSFLHMSVDTADVARDVAGLVNHDCSTTVVDVSVPQVDGLRPLLGSGIQKQNAEDGSSAASTFWGDEWKKLLMSFPRSAFDSVFWSRLLILQCYRSWKRSPKFCGCAPLNTSTWISRIAEHERRIQDDRLLEQVAEQIQDAPAKKRINGKHEKCVVDRTRLHDRFQEVREHREPFLQSLACRQSGTKSCVWEALTRAVCVVNLWASIDNAAMMFVFNWLFRITWMRLEQDVKLFLWPLCLHAKGNLFQPRPTSPQTKTTLLLASHASVRGSVVPAGCAGKSTCSSQKGTYELPVANITADGAVRLWCGSVVPAKCHQQRIMKRDTDIRKNVRPWFFKSTRTVDVAPSTMRFKVVVPQKRKYSVLLLEPNATASCERCSSQVSSVDLFFWRVESIRTDILHSAASKKKKINAQLGEVLHLGTIIGKNGTLKCGKTINGGMSDDNARVTHRPVHL